MKTDTYLYVYERIDGSTFEVVNQFRDDETASESAKLALSKHVDLKSARVYRCDEVMNLKKDLV